MPPLLLLVLLGCQQEIDCSTMSPGIERDQCLHDELIALPPDQGAAVLETGALIQDPVYRGAAIYAWISEHAAAVPRPQGEAICQLIEGTERGLCERRLQSAHLLR